MKDVGRNRRRKPRRSVGGGPKGSQQKCSRFRSELENLVLGRCVDAIEKIFSITTRRPCLEGLSCTQAYRKVKEWTMGVDVLVSTARLGRRERMGCRFSFFLLKKAFPEPCDCLSLSLEDWFKERSRPHTGVLPDDFLPFVREEVQRIYPEGWDHDYVNMIGLCVPNSSSCVERPLSKGGSRAAISLDDYLSGVVGDRKIRLAPYVLKSINTGGKQRLLTVTPVDLCVLKPLHKLLFNRIRRQRWSLIGPPKTRSFEKAGFKFKHPILSGDFKGATDNLDLRVSQAILEAALDNASMIPDEVKQLARMSLLPDIQFGDNVLTNRRGQMMGAFLSFPLLCLYNRVCAAYTLGRRTPMLINGDDLAAETSDPSRWFNLLPSVGLQPEPDKTKYERNVVEINSTMFLWTGWAIRVPTVRCRSLLKTLSTACIGGNLESFAAEAGELRTRAEDHFMACFRGNVVKGLHLGLELGQLGFAPRHLDCLRRTGVFQTAFKVAKRLHRTTPLPSPSGCLTDTTAIYGKLDKTLRAESNYLMAGDLFGTVSPHVDTARYIRSWWDQLYEDGCYPSPPVKLHSRFEQWWSRCRPFTLFFGEPMPAVKFKRRLISSLECKKPTDRIATALIHRVAPSVRWDLKFTAELLGPK